jgi:predicted PurR-regulated permease PerM
VSDEAADPAPAGRFGGPERTWALPRATIIALELAGLVVVAFGMAAIGGILAPVVLSLILTICVHPVRSWLTRKGLPRGVATGSVIIVVFALLAGFIGLFIVAVANFATLLPEFAPELEDFGANVTAFLTSLGFGPEQIQAIAAGFDAGNLASLAGSVLGGVTGTITFLVIVLTCLILMGVDGGYVPNVLRQVQPRRPDLVGALTGFGHGVRRYMVVTTILGVAQGIFNWLALTALQVPGALLWGMLSFLCSFIPNIGYFIAIIPPLVFGAFVGGWPTVIAIIVIYGVINAIVQSVVQPRVVGNAVQLSQTLTFVSVLFWAVVLGPIGAILAVPLTLLVRTILIDADPATRWWRPMTGDFDQTKVDMKAEDVQRKADRRARKADEGWVEDASPAPDSDSRPGAGPVAAPDPRADPS